MEIDIKQCSLNGGFDPYALEWDATVSFPTTRKIKQYGNRVFNRYPARSICLVPRATLNIKSEGGRKSLNVLDPFMGSGTTAVEAKRYGSIIYGTEMDPFARLIAETSLIQFTSKEEDVLTRAFKYIICNYKKINADPKLYPDLSNIEYWFEPEVFHQLLQLKTAIFTFKDNDNIFKFLLVAFADAIKPCSKMERQSTKPYISSKYTKRIKPVAESFEYSFTKHLEALKSYEESGSSCINWLGTDATNIAPQSFGIDIAITSPPYLNALDYTQIIKVDSAWTGMLENSMVPLLKGKQVGHEKRIRQTVSLEVGRLFSKYFERIATSAGKGTDRHKLKIAQTCLSYFEDMRANLMCVYDLLKPNGEYHIIIGDNTIRGVDIPTHRIIAELAKLEGFEWFGYYKYPIKDHRTSIPRKDNGGKIKYEFVLMLRK